MTHLRTVSTSVQGQGSLGVQHGYGVMILSLLHSLSLNKIATESRLKAAGCEGT